METPSPSRPVLGIFWMVVTGILFVAVTAVVKHLNGAVPAAQAAFLRYLLGLVFIFPMIPAIMRARLTKRQIKLFGIRGILHTLAVILWFFAMSQIPIAEVTAMNYLSPVYVTIGAAIFLREKLALRRIFAVCVALMGVLIILRPGFREIEMGHLAMLGTAVLFAGGYLIAKQMSSEVNPVVIVAMLSLIVTIGLFPPAIAVWITPTWTQVAWLFLVACLATAGHYTMTLAFASAPLTVTQPITFLQLVWATLLGFFLFSEKIDIFTILGGTVILGSVVFITWREAQMKRKVITPTVNATKV